jgi:hypothetical protein
MNGRWIPSYPPNPLRVEDLSKARAEIGDRPATAGEQAWLDQEQQILWRGRWAGWQSLPNPDDSPAGWNALHGDVGGAYPVSRRWGATVPERFWAGPVGESWPDSEYWR